MPNSGGVDVEDPDFPTTYNCSDVEKMAIVTTIDSTPQGQHHTNCGAPSQVLPNETESSNGIATQNPFYSDNFYPGAETLLNQRLILPNDLKSPFDIRYKSHYFPYSGKNVGKPQTLRCLCTVDDASKIVIKFPNGCIMPPNPRDYWIEIVLLTIPRMNQHHIHVNKFQQDHKNIEILDQNPLIISLTPEQFEKGEIRVKLVLIKMRNNELENIKSLSIFGDQSTSGEIADCKSVEDLKETYQLNRAMLAFSLGYCDTNNRFIRFTNTTVVSNEIIEIDQSNDEVTCPHCSHHFSVREEKEKSRKRSASSSSSTRTKRSS